MKMINLSEVRKELHRIPELAFQEFKTKELLLSYLSDLDDFTIHQFKESNGILVEYSHGVGAYQLFRADMDALPITEATESNFISQHKGIMHACGHDIHMTILLGLIYKVADMKPKKNLLFLFQPAEEGEGGAESVLGEGLIQSYDVKQVFALHVNGNLPVGTVSSKPGIFFAIPQEFDVEFTGISAHAAFPQNGKDALAAGVEFYDKMHSYIEQVFGMESVIFNIGEFHAGNIRNIIPDKCILKGTHRTLDKNTRDLINTEINSIAESVAQKHNLEFKLSLLCTYDPVINDEELFEKLKTICSELSIDFRDSVTFMTGEDFGFFTSLYPGLLFWLGAGEDAHDLHSNRFMPDDNCIPTGIDILYHFI